MRGLRGATTVEENTAQAIWAATQEVVSEIRFVDLVESHVLLGERQAAHKQAHARDELVVEHGLLE